MNAAEAMKARLRADLKAAMRSRCASEAQVLRMLLGAIDNAEAVPLPHGERGYVVRAFGEAAEKPRLLLTAADVLAVIRRHVETSRAAAAEMERVGQPDRADTIRAEAVIAERYLDG